MTYFRQCFAASFKMELNIVVVDLDLMRRRSL
jgi:hypothetical protein